MMLGLQCQKPKHSGVYLGDVLILGPKLKHSKVDMGQQSCKNLGDLQVLGQKTKPAASTFGIS